MDQYNKVSEQLINFFPKVLADLINQYKLEPDYEYHKRLDKCINQFRKEYGGLAGIYDDLPKIGHNVETKTLNYIVYRCYLDIESRIFIIQGILVNEMDLTTRQYVERGLANPTRRKFHKEFLKFKLPLAYISSEGSAFSYFRGMGEERYIQRSTILWPLGKKHERFSRDKIKFS